MNHQRTANHKELKMLKETFGDDWREGMRKHPEIDRVSEHEINVRKAQLQRENDRKHKEAMREGLEECLNRGQISPEQMRKFDNELTKKYG